MNLADLIDAHKGARSYADLERDCGGVPKAARIHQLATKPQRNFPDPPTIEGLSRGLRVPAATIVLAAAETVGLDVGRASTGFFDRFPAGVERLSEDQMRVLILMAQSLVDANSVIRVVVDDDSQIRPIQDRSSAQP